MLPEDIGIFVQKNQNTLFLRNVAMNCELNADWTAAYLLIAELLYDTIDGHPDTRILAYTKERLIYLWSTRIFACYLAMSWHIRGEDRIWSEKELSSFISDSTIRHPLYEFRLYNIIGKIKELLDHMALTCEDDEHFLYTADRIRIDPNMLQEVWKKSEEMIYSFEYAFSADWNSDERTLQEKIDNSLNILNPTQSNPERIPFYLCFMQQAQEELKQYEAQWPEILEKLRRYGMYYVM